MFPIYVDGPQAVPYNRRDLRRVSSRMLKNEIRKSQSFTFGEVSLALELMRFATRSNDLKVLAQKADFISLYRKFSRMRDKISEEAASGKASESSDDDLD
jgi:hypothetical protein